MSAFLATHGGLMGTILATFIAYNLFMSFLAGIFNFLGKQEPVILQKASAFGTTVVQWMSANMPTVTTTPNPIAVVTPVIPPVVVHATIANAVLANPEQVIPQGKN